MNMWRVRRLGTLAALALLATACEREPEAPEMPPPEVVRSYYGDPGSLQDVEIRGNVVQVEFEQSSDQLRRGGSLWARVGPYIYLFSPGTRRIFDFFPDVAAVRVVTYGPGGEEIGRAMLPRDELTENEWLRSQNLLGLALRDAGTRPSTVEDLVEWGEDHTEFSYNPEFVPER